MANPTKEFLEAQMRVWLNDAANYILTANKAWETNGPQVKPSDNLIQGAEAVKAFTQV